MYKLILIITKLKLNLFRKHLIRFDGKLIFWKIHKNQQNLNLSDRVIIIIYIHMARIIYSSNKDHIRLFSIQHKHFV